MDAAIGRMRFVDKVENLTGCDWVIEAVVEDAKVKRDLFSKLAAMYPSPSVVLASNTSSISITEIATACGPTAGRLQANCSPVAVRLRSETGALRRQGKSAGDLHAVGLS